MERVYLDMCSLKGGLEEGVMNRAATLSNYEIRAEGWKALTERLGVSGAIRFLMEYDPGRGDYVAERHELFRDLMLDGAIARARETSGRSPSP